VDRRRLLIALLWPTALVVLVGVLAFFQYRWLGQVSEADRARQRTTLNQRAREFAADFDREIGHVYNALQFDPALPDANDTLARRYAEWRDGAAFPQLVGRIFLTTEYVGEDAPVTVTAFDPATHTFSPAEWPASLDAVRDRLVTMRHRFSAPATPFSSVGSATFRFVSISQSPVFAAVPALLIPLPTVQPLPKDGAEAEFATGADEKGIVRFDIEPRYLVVELDKNVLATAVIPALVEKHLAVDDYRVEVLTPTSDGHSTAVFRKGLAADADISADNADAWATFFSVRTDNLRDALLRTAGRSVAGPTQAAATSRMSIVVAETPRDAKAAAELKAVESALQSQPAAGGRISSTGSTAGAGGAGGAGGGAILAFGSGAWQLLLQHPAGSLEAAVAGARRRNLAISFGVLAVLSVSVFLISINAQRSQQLAAQQMDFVATVSHELRTPIAVIRSAAQNLSAGVIHDEARAKKYGELIDTEGRRLTEMVEEVLEFAGISGGKRQFAIAPTDIGQLTNDVVNSSASLIREAGFEVEVAVAPDLPAVNLDESAYRRALNNLIGNALKYGADGHWLSVVVNAVPHHQVVVTVTDKGRGIDTKDVPHIFDAFYRGAYAKDRQIHGNGLGLSLVKRIAEAHGGTVSVRTSPAGSAFSMTFPVHA
jgi:signal transduction histidine kinase